MSENLPRAPTPSPILRQAKRLRRLPQGRGKGGAPRRGCDMPAQGSALGDGKQSTFALKGQKNTNRTMILPLQGVTPRYTLFPERCPGLAYRSPFGARAVPQFPCPAPFPREEAILCHSINGLKGQQYVSPRLRLGGREAINIRPERAKEYK